MNVASILNKAADLIEERGWIKGAEGWGFARGSRLCIEGAIAEAMGLDGDPTWGHCTHVQAVNTSPPGMALREFLGDALWSVREGYNEATRKSMENHNHMPMLYEWNDKFHRTEPEVIEALRATAIIAAAREVPVRVVTA